MGGMKMTMWPNYYYWPYVPVRTDMTGPGMMGTGMTNQMMEPDQMKKMMAMMKEHMETTKGIKETVDRIEQRLIAMDKMMKR
jgi:hypothetical protein